MPAIFYAVYFTSLLFFESPSISSFRFFIRFRTSRPFTPLTHSPSVNNSAAYNINTLVFYSSPYKYLWRSNTFDVQVIRSVSAIIYIYIPGALNPFLCFYRGVVTTWILSLLKIERHGTSTKSPKYLMHIL